MKITGIETFVVSNGFTPPRPWHFCAIRTDAGSYHWAFLISGSMCMGASFAVTRIRTRVPRPAAA